MWPGLGGQHSEVGANASVSRAALGEARHGLATVSGELDSKTSSSGSELGAGEETILDEFGPGPQEARKAEASAHEQHLKFDLAKCRTAWCRSWERLAERNGLLQSPNELTVAPAGWQSLCDPLDP